MGSILDHVSFLLNIITAAIIASQWESTGIRRNLLEMVGMCQNLWIPIISSGFQWIPSDSVGISMELEPKMAEVQAKWILLEFHGILMGMSESAGTHGGV